MALNKSDSNWKEITHWISLHIFVSLAKAHRHERDVSNERERERDDDTKTRRRRFASITLPLSASPSPSAHFSRRVIVKIILREKKKVRMDDVPTKRDNNNGRVDRLRRALARPGATGRRGDVRFARGRDERRRRPRFRRHRRRHSVPIGAGVSRRVETLRNGPQKRRRRKRRDDFDGMSDTKKKRKWNDDARDHGIRREGSRTRAERRI